jgi:hypothetical protein
MAKVITMQGTYSQNVHNGLIERRSGNDRRKRRIPTFSELLTRRRRHQLRRKEDRRRIVLFDRYSRSVVLMVMVILVLSITDALLTLFLLDHGAVELNPIMAFFLEIGATTFMMVKYALTALSVSIILVLNYAFVRHLNLQARTLLNYFAGLFALVVVWELFLVARYVL